MQNYFFNLSGTTVTENIQLFRRRPNAMKTLFGQLLEIDTRCIDCNSLIKMEDGLQCGLTIFSFDPQKQSRSSTLLKIYQYACPVAPNVNQTFFADAVIEIMKLNKHDYDYDIKITNIVAFFETQNNSKHNKYFEMDWKNICESDLYQSNAHNFSTKKIGIYLTICVNIDHDQKRIDAQAQLDHGVDIVYVSGGDGGASNIELEQVSNNINIDNKTSAIEHFLNQDECDLQLIMNLNETTIGALARENDANQDLDHKMESKDDIEIVMAGTDGLQPIQSIKYCKSSIVANFEAMTAMMDQMRDFHIIHDQDDGFDNTKDKLQFPQIAQRKTYCSQGDMKSNNSVQNEHTWPSKVRSATVN